MKLEITINMDNAIFQDHLATELPRVLAQVAQKVCGNMSYGPVMDLNGNTCGRFYLKEIIQYECRECGTGGVNAGIWGSAYLDKNGEIEGEDYEIDEKAEWKCRNPDCEKEGYESDFRKEEK